MTIAPLFKGIEKLDKEELESIAKEGHLAMTETNLPPEAWIQMAEQAAHSGAEELVEQFLKNAGEEFQNSQQANVYRHIAYVTHQVKNTKNYGEVEDICERSLEKAEELGLRVNADGMKVNIANVTLAKLASQIMPYLSFADDCLAEARKKTGPGNTRTLVEKMEAAVEEAKTEAAKVGLPAANIVPIVQNGEFHWAIAHEKPEDDMKDVLYSNLAKWVVADMRSSFNAKLILEYKPGDSPFLDDADVFDCGLLSEAFHKDYNAAFALADKANMNEEQREKFNEKLKQTIAKADAYKVLADVYARRFDCTQEGLSYADKMKEMYDRVMEFASIADFSEKEKRRFDMDVKGVFGVFDDIARMRVTNYARARSPDRFPQAFKEYEKFDQYFKKALGRKGSVSQESLMVSKMVGLDDWPIQRGVVLDETQCQELNEKFRKRADELYKQGSLNRRQYKLANRMLDLFYSNNGHDTKGNYAMPQDQQSMAHPFAPQFVEREYRRKSIMPRR